MTTSKFFFGLILFGFLATLSSAQDSEEVKRDEDGVKWIEFMHKDEMIRVPFYERGLDKVPEARKKIDVEYATALKNELDRSAYDFYVKKKSLIYMMSYTKPIWNCMHKFSKMGIANRKAGQGVQYLPEYKPRIMKMLRDALALSKDYQLESNPTPVEFHREMVEVFDIIIECIERSPVGAYLDWSRMTFNEKRIHDKFANLFQYSRKNGYSIGLIEIGLNLFTRFTQTEVPE